MNIQFVGYIFYFKGSFIYKLYQFIKYIIRRDFFKMEVGLRYTIIPEDNKIQRFIHRFNSLKRIKEKKYPYALLMHHQKLAYHIKQLLCKHEFEDWSRELTDGSKIVKILCKKCNKMKEK